MHPVRIICPCLAISGIDCERAGDTDAREVFGYVNECGISEACSILIMVVVVGYSLDIGVNLCLVANDFDITYLAVTLVAMKNKKAVLEHWACTYLERGVMRKVCCSVIYLQKYAV